MYGKALLKIYITDYPYKNKSYAKYAVVDRIIKINFTELSKVTSEIDPHSIEKKFLSQTEYLDLIRYTKGYPYEHAIANLFAISDRYACR